LSTFISEFLTLVGTFTRHKAIAIIGTAGIILAALYVLLLYQRTMQGPVLERVRAFRDLNVRETFAIAPLIVLIVALGVYPRPIIDIINPAIGYTMHDVGQTDPQPQHVALPGGQK
jgi:NADH-quinone oxidoreductase subunit M